MSIQIETLFDVCDRLERANIPYMLSGAMALNFLGFPRMTLDFDLVIDLPPGTGHRIADVLEPDYHLDRDTIKESLLLRRMFNALSKKTYVKADFIVRKNIPYRLEEFRRRRLFDFEGKKIWMVTTEDLILSKLHWAKDSHSDYQLRDVKNLILLPNLDQEYLAHWAKELEVSALLDEVRK